MHVPDSPAELGLAINIWREHQQEVVQWLADYEAQAQILIAPTGSGKSPIKQAVARHLNLYTHSLTATKQQQDQEIKSLPMTNVLKGKSNYDCFIDMMVTVPDAKCATGWKCPEKYRCEYFMKRNLANTHRYSSMNYDYYIAERRFRGQMPPPQLLLCDEAHAIERILMGTCTININKHQCDSFDVQLPPSSISKAMKWATDLHPRVASKLQVFIDIKSSGMLLTKEQMKREKQVRDFLTQLEGLISITDISNWVEEYRSKTYVQFKPITVSSYGDLIFKGAGRIILLSATIPNIPYFAESIGLPPYTSKILPSTFNPARRPIIIDPISQRLNFQTEGPGKPAWNEMVQKVDEILDHFPTRKGLIHTVSFGRAQYIKQHSKHSHKMIAPTTPEHKDLVLSKWMDSSTSRILLSPSTWEGTDLPGVHNEIQIITKLNYCDRRSPQLVARMKQDSRYESSQVGLFLAQAAGRAMRGPEDSGVTFICDPAIQGFMNRSGEYLPSWFHDAVVRTRKAA